MNDSDHLNARKHGADIEAADTNQQTALMNAAYHGRTEVAQLLIFPLMRKTRKSLSIKSLSIC